MSPTQPAESAAEHVLRKLAELRPSLPENEQRMLDSMVAQASGEQPSPGDASPDAAGVTEEEQGAFLAKLQDYRDTLPERERGLLDSMVVAVGAAEAPDVEGHAIHWVRVGETSSWEIYKNACEGVGGGYHLGGKYVLGEVKYGDPIPFSNKSVYTCYGPGGGWW
jgi:hypothetical protein